MILNIEWLYTAQNYYNEHSISHLLIDPIKSNTLGDNPSLTSSNKIIWCFAFKQKTYRHVKPKIIYYYILLLYTSTARLNRQTDESSRALIPSLSAIGGTIFQWFWSWCLNSLTWPTDGSSSHLWKWRSSTRVKSGGIQPEIKERKCGQRQHWRTRDSEAL